MTTPVYLNGEFLSLDDARTSAFDAGLQHAVGLFETLLVVRPDPADPDASPRAHRLVEHLDRLATSARELGLVSRLGTDALAEAVLLTADRSGVLEHHDRARVRITITGGSANLLKAEAPHRPTVLVVAQPPTPYPDALFEHGARVVLADARLNPLNPLESHKTLNYWMRLRELQAAAAQGAAEALMLQVSNHLAGGCVSNCLLIKNGTLLTPIARGEEQPGALPSPVLPGITRASLLEHARELGLTTETRMLAIDEVLDADEVMLTNSSWGVMPVVAVESRPIASGEPGPVTRQLRARWLAELC